MKPLKEFFRKVDFLIVAHRGSSGTAPENTLASFDQAIQAGAHFVELDLQITRDSVPIVFHDKWLSRTTDGIGSIRNFTLNEIRKFDSGFWFSDRYKGEKIPTLEEVLELIHNKVYLNIEIKNIGPNPLPYIQKTISIIDKFNYLDKVVFSSFYYNNLFAIRTIDYQIPTACLRIPKDKSLPSALAQKFQCQGFICSTSEINEEIVEDVKLHNLFVGVYSVDTEDELNRIVKLDCDAIVTNFPQKIRELLITKYKAKV